MKTTSTQVQKARPTAKGSGIGIFRGTLKRIRTGLSHLEPFDNWQLRITMARLRSLRVAARRKAMPLIQPATGELSVPWILCIFVSWRA